jgi:hypothetical protein
MTATCAYDCEGCGVHVLGFGRTEPPGHRLCAVCEWLNLHETPERIMELRRRVEPGGWVPEPRHTR